MAGYSCIDNYNYIVLQDMLSKAQIKYIRSLTQQKSRNEFKVFVVDGVKMATEWLTADGHVHMIVATDAWISHNTALIARHPEAELHIVKDHELEAMSAVQTPNQVMLVVAMPDRPILPQLSGWNIALDNIQDPGNMGTIIRIADWFGIATILCSPGCVDVYNPKVVQSAMGGHLRVHVFETELEPVLGTTNLTKYAATLHGENVYQVQRADSGVLIIGNESRGISPAVAAMATRHVTIPRRGGAESLNAGVSAGILCALLLPG